MVKQSKYLAKDGDRLDSIVYKHYGTLEPLEMVAAENSELGVLLQAGDMVLLPAYEIKPKANKLW